MTLIADDNHSENEKELLSCVVELVASGVRVVSITVEVLSERAGLLTGGSVPVPSANESGGTKRARKRKVIVKIR